MKNSTDEFIKSMIDLLNNKNDITRKKFEKELLAVTLLTPALFIDLDADKKLDRRNVSFATITDNENRVFFLAFTSSKKFKKFQKEHDFTEVDATLDHFKHLLTEVDNTAHGILIDPEDAALFLPRNVVLELR